MRLFLERLARLSWCEWRLREQSSLFGFAWTLLHPLLMFLALWLVFTRWLGPRDPGFPGRLLVGLVHYGFFSSATSYAVTCLRRRRGILRNFPVPPELLVLSAVASVAASFTLELFVLAAVLAALGHAPSPAWALEAAAAAGLIAAAAGAAFPLAAVGARYPDFERVWAIAVQAGFFLTPVFYAAADVPDGQRRVLALNPLTHFIEAARACLLGGPPPSVGRMAALLLGGATAAAAGWGLFRTRARGLADDVAV